MTKIRNGWKLSDTEVLAENQYLGERKTEGYYVARLYFCAETGARHFVLLSNEPGKPALLCIHLGNGEWSAWQEVP